MMKTKKNSIEKLKRMKLGVNTPQNRKYTAKQEEKNVRLSDINNKGESSVKAERKFNAASKDGTKLLMPNDEN